MKQRDQSLLGLRTQINEEIAAIEYIQLRKGGIFEQVMCGECDTIAQLTFHPVVAVFPREK